MLNEDLTTALIKSTAKLNDTKTFSASATVNNNLPKVWLGTEFEPQAQLVYQQLSFDTLSDADNLEIDMKNPHQWLSAN